MHDHYDYYRVDKHLGECTNCHILYTQATKYLALSHATLNNKGKWNAILLIHRKGYGCLYLLPQLLVAL